ncbi:MAG: methyltransferase domain-containing protein [Nitrospirota bacterium]|nr:methyltransferase domain-containing protein [Nitrospirota bacterium]
MNEPVIERRQLRKPQEAAMKVCLPKLSLIIVAVVTFSVAPSFDRVLCVAHAQTHDESSHHRRPADIHQYLEHLDGSQRDTDQQPERVIEALGLQPGLSVADIGAGSGYFTRRFVQAVTQKGKVYAVDVEPDMLQYAQASIARMPIPSTVEFILAQPDNPQLPLQSGDLVFLCNVYHHLNDRSVYFSKVRPALKPGGRIAIIDFYHDARSGDVGFPRKHLVPRDTVVEEMAKAGFQLTREHTFLARQYFLEFSPTP